MLILDTRDLVKCQAAIQIQLLISIIDFLVFEIPISHIRNTILTSKSLLFFISAITWLLVQILLVSTITLPLVYFFIMYHHKYNTIRTGSPK